MPTRLIIHFQPAPIHQPQPWPIGITDGTVTSGLGPDDGAQLIGFGPRGKQTITVLADAAIADPASVVGLVPTFGNAGMFSWDIPVAELVVTQLVTVRIDNAYSDGHTSTAQVQVVAPTDLTETTLTDWWQEVVFPHTGDGHGIEPHITSCYTATVIDAADPTFVGATTEWS